MRFMTENRVIAATVLVSTLIVAVACKPEGSSRDKSKVYTYKLTGTYEDGKKRKIGGRYEYGSRAANISSGSGKVATRITTAGPKTVTFNVNSKVNGLRVKCEIVVTTKGSQPIKITNVGRNSTTCRFTA